MEQSPDGWSEELKGGVEILTRTFEFENFAQAMTFAVHVGEAADAADHHPEIIVSWGRVRVDWWSHDANGVTSRDISLAETTNRLYF
ncbi:MAG: pterin-4-alpha-carbinolamine dehydratase [Gammaproteobacteria bacterium]|nr:pterin-4-alpha-carbinolamine dehydratase [Gammaproteobacteria bacterium]